MPDLSLDIRSALRQLVRNPGFSLMAIVVLAVAIGGVTAMYSFVNALVVRPLPGVRSAEVMRVYDETQKPTPNYRNLTYSKYQDLRARQDAFTDLAGFTVAFVGVEEGAYTKRVFALLATSNYFDLLGVHMAQGRTFVSAEEKPGSAVPVVIVSHRFWQRHGADPALVGNTVRVNGQDFQVVGVLPPSFTGITPFLTPDFFFPLGLFETLAGMVQGPEHQRLDDPTNETLMVLGRLRPGQTAASAQARLQGLATQLAAAYPKEGTEPRFEVGPQSRMGLGSMPERSGDAISFAALLLGFSLVVLVIACMNLANLLLAKGASRSKEMAIRLALGGQRWQILRQLLGEGLLLSLGGGLGGLMLAHWLMNLLGATVNSRVPMGGFSLESSPDFRVYGATLAFCILSTLLFALGPAWKAARPDLVSELKGQTGEARAVRRRFQWMKPMNLIVVGQVALSLALLTAAGLFFRGAQSAAKADPGFPMQQGLVAELDGALAGYTPQQCLQAYAKVREDLKGLPGVVDTSAAFTVPFGMMSDGRSVVPDEDAATGRKPESANANQISDAYFRTLGVPLLQGREFSPSETFSLEAAPVAIIDRNLAEKLWPGKDPLGRWIQFHSESPASPRKPLQVVGVAPVLRDSPTDNAQQTHVFTPLGREFQTNVNLHLRLAPGANLPLAMLRSRIHAVDPRMPILNVRSMPMIRDANLFIWFYQAMAGLFAFFGLLALFLASVGLYGVKAQVVAQRGREFGIRMAVGASPGSVLGMVLKEGMVLALVGLAFGSLLALGVSSILRSFLFEVKGLDVPTFLVSPLILLAIAGLASFIPAMRASRIQPNQALRGE
jgi:predicted permease